MAFTAAQNLHDKRQLGVGSFPNLQIRQQAVPTLHLRSIEGVTTKAAYTTVTIGTSVHS